MGDDQIGITAPKTFLSKQFDMKDMGSPCYRFGIEVANSSSGYTVSQLKYTEDILH